MDVKVEMPAAIPTQSNTICLPQGHGEEMAVPKAPTCKTSDLKKSGNKTTFKMICNGKGNSMTGSGEIEQLGSYGYRGKTHLVINSGKERMEMTQTFSGKRLGKCDYPPRK